MTKVELKGSLLDFLEENKENIDYVVLNYRWSPYYYVGDSSFYGDVWTQKYGVDKWPLTHCFTGDEIDEEYSYIGDVEGAINFAEGYGCWDEETLELDNGVLIGEKEEWNYQEEYAGDLENMDSVDVINIQYCGLVYFHDNKRRYYKGPIYRKNEDDTYTKVGEV